MSNNLAARPWVRLRGSLEELKPSFAPHTWLFLFIAAALIGLVAPPLFFIVYSSVIAERGPEAGSLTFRYFENLLASPSEIGSLIGNSFIFSVGSTAGAITLGTLLAWLAERTNAPFRSAAYLSAYLSFAIPGIIKVIGWIFVLGGEAGILNVAFSPVTGGSPLFELFSMQGMILVETFLWMPVVFLLMATPFRSMDPSLEESALVSGSTGWQVFVKVTLPLALPSLLAVSILTLVRSLEAFEIPALIGLPAGIEVLTTQIYLQIKGGFIPRYGEASAYSVLLMLLVGLALIPYYRITQQTHMFTTVTGKGFRPRKIDLRSWRWLGGLCLLFLPLLQVLPLLALLWVSLLPYARQPSFEALALVSFKNYWAAFGDSAIVQSVLNSLTVSGTAATAAVLATFVSAWLVVRTPIRGRWLLDQLATIPLVFPSIVLGVAVLKTYLTIPLPVYGTIWILVIAYITRYLPYGMRFSHAGLLSLHHELEESAKVSGATWGTVLRTIVVPLMLPSLFAAWIYIFLITIRELSVALLLYSPGSQVISITIWEFWENGNTGELAAFSLVITGGTVLFAAAFQRLAERRSFHI